MNSKNNPRHLKSFLLSQRDKYIKHLIEIGIKLSKTGHFNEQNFVEQFIPNKDLIIQKIKEKVENDIEISKDNEATTRICMDSYLFEMICKEVENYRKDLDTVRKNTNPHNKEDVKQSTETMETASNCGSINEKFSSNDELRTNNYAQTNHKNGFNTFQRNNNNFEDDSISVTEELLPGQKSTIIVRKSNVNTVKTNVEKPEFDDEIREEIQIFRKKIN